MRVSVKSSIFNAIFVIFIIGSTPRALLLLHSAIEQVSVEYIEASNY